MRTVKSIFLVEDDLDDQEFFLDALIEIEYSSLYGIANNGHEALEKLKHYIKPDLIFMDINMPRMNGIECLSRILLTDKTRYIPVVILSTAIVHLEKVRSLGARGFIEKPSDNRVLKSQIERMINMDFTWDVSNSNQPFTALYRPKANMIH